MFACGILRRNYQQLISLRTCVENVFVRDFQGLLNPALKCSTYQLSTLAVGNELEEETSVLVAATADADVEHECVEVGVIGVPNAGKSTLVNAIVGSKVSAVSQKTNTTVQSRLGAFTEGPTQVVLFDTPGVVAPGKNLKQQQLRRIQSAWKTAANCDVLLFVIDAHRQLIVPDPRVIRLIENLGSTKVPGLSARIALPPLALVFNKVDLVGRELKPMMLPLVDQFQKMAEFEEVFWTSAEKGEGVGEVKEYVLGKRRPGEWMVPADASTDADAFDVACEIVREKVFRAYYQEVPYELEIVPESYKELRDGSVRIELDIMVKSSTQKSLVVGRKGASIGWVSTTARVELEEMWATMESAQQAARQMHQKGNNRNIFIFGGIAAVLGYYFYKKNQHDVKNLGDAASKTGAAVGRGLEQAGASSGSPTMVQEGRGFQGKK